MSGVRSSANQMQPKLTQLLDFFITQILRAQKGDRRTEDYHRQTLNRFQHFF